MDSRSNTCSTTQSACVESGMSDSLRVFVTPQEFAERSGLSMSSVRRYLADGRLPKSQPGGPRCRVLIPVDALQQTSPKSVLHETASRAVNPSAEAAPGGATSHDLSGPQPEWRKRSK